MAHGLRGEEAPECGGLRGGVGSVGGQTEPPCGQQRVVVVVRKRDQGSVALHASTLAVKLVAYAKGRLELSLSRELRCEARNTPRVVTTVAEAVVLRRR